MQSAVFSDCCLQAWMSNMAARGYMFYLLKACRTSIYLWSQQQTGSVSNIRGWVVLGCGVWQDSRGEATCDRQVHCGATGARPRWAPIGVPHGTIHEACHRETMASSPAQDWFSSSGLRESLGRGAIAGGTEHLTVKHTAVLIGCWGQKAAHMQAYWSIYKHAEKYMSHMQTHIQTHTFYICQSRDRTLQPKGKTMCVSKRERKKRVETERLNAEERLGAFPLALTGEINHHNYGPAQVNGDRSPLSFPSSRCFLLIRASQAWLPTDPWPMRSKCALDACETLGISRELVLHISAGALTLTRYWYCSSV